jgi:hypothetical protein
MSSFSTFPLFPRLLLELQNEIWKLASENTEPRLITFPPKNGRVPAVLHACHISRSITKDYKPLNYREHGKDREWAIPINFKVDIVFLSDDMPFGVASIQIASLLNSIKKLAVSRLSHLSLFYINKGFEYNKQWLTRFRVWFPKVEEFTFIVNGSARKNGEYGDLIKSDDLPSITLFRDLGTDIEQIQNGASSVDLKFNVRELRKTVGSK